MSETLAKVPHAHSGGFFNCVINGRAVPDEPFTRPPDGWIDLGDLEAGLWFIEPPECCTAETADEAELAGFRAVYQCDECKAFTIFEELDSPDWRMCRQCR